MTARCADKSKQTATPPPKITWLSVDSIQPDVVDVGVERTSKFLHVPLGIGGWPLGYKERRCWANCSRSYFPRLSTYVVIIHQRHRRTDRRTGDMRLQDRALHYSASRGKKYCKKTTIILTDWTDLKKFIECTRRRRAQCSYTLHPKSSARHQFPALPWNNIRLHSHRVQFNYVQLVQCERPFVPATLWFKTALLYSFSDRLT